MFLKLGEQLEISNIESVGSCVPLVPADVLANFQKFAMNLKKIAPKADDFLYFSAIMMHSAEAAALNDDGTPRLTASGQKVEVSWDKSGGTWRWVSNDPNVRAYKNSNGDIFPEEELVKAYKKWVGKPLCVDHKSSSVEHVRGFIVDTYYDRNLKRVVALCALDKAGYPQLARQITTGVSNCVSMGTAVGKAICSDCARVARTEADFCDHMRRKSCYGEINVDLNPIELSIVVNGADPKANIKHIIAAANTLNNYVGNKQKELEKLAGERYTANFSFNNDSGASADNTKVTNVSVISQDLETFKKDVEKAIAAYQEIESSLSDEEKNQESGNNTASQLADDSQTADLTPPADDGLAPPHARFAASAEVDENTVTELRNITKSIEAKLSSLKDSLNKLSHNSHTHKKQEETMSGNNINKQGYFQGAGGVNEPTPGQAKYTKDPLNEQLREHEDKQMVGQPPFPEVGKVDGMHPSPASADPSDELQRKKMLARAEAEERAMRRQAIVQLAKDALESKKAYMQGGGGVNEPTPGKVKYPKDKLNEQDRDHEDKQMVGQKPFPGVGNVDGLHPSPGSADVADELKRKEMLARASLRARFVKAANANGSQNFAKSAWEVFMGDKLILTASVDDLSGGNSDVLYDSIATKSFGAKLLEKVQKEGADKVLAKKAQVPPSAAPEAPAADVAPAPEASATPEVEDTGKDGDPKETILHLSEKAQDIVSDMVEAARALTGEQAEMGAMDETTPAMGATASFGTASLNNIRRELNAGLTAALKESIAEINEHRQALDMLSDLHNKGGVNASNADMLGTITTDTFNDTKSAIAQATELMVNFCKYARGTKHVVKRAEMEAQLAALAVDGDAPMTSEHDEDTHSADDLMNLIQSTDSDLDAVHSLLADDADLDLEEGLVDDNEAMLSVKPGETVPSNLPEGVEVEVKHASFDTKEGRAQLRAKLAADALGKQDDGEVQDMSKAKFSDMLEQADRLADGQTHLDTKPSDNLGRVETPEEQNDRFMEVAKMAPKVRKEAEAIQRLVSQGKLDPSDLDALVVEGLDKDAVSYWKKYYAQTDGGSEFASELVKEHAKAQLEEQLNVYRVKLARAYELAYDMVDRGLCGAERSTISSQVDEIMKCDDSSFEQIKRVVARNAPNMRKEAGRMPQVGMINGGSEVHSSQKEEGSLFSELSAAFATSSKKMF